MAQDIPSGRMLGGLTSCLGGGAWGGWHWAWPAKGLRGMRNVRVPRSRLGGQCRESSCGVTLGLQSGKEIPAEGGWSTMLDVQGLKKDM